MWLAAAALLLAGSVDLAPGTHAAFDRFGRLVAAPGRVSVACPSPGPRTAVVVVAGQSNAGNHGEPGAGAAQRSLRIVNWIDGRCVEAVSPLLGATGEGSAYWPRLATRWVEAGQFDAVVIAPFAVGGSPIAWWAGGGRLHRAFVDEAARLNAWAPVTHVLWHQGEADFLRGTSAPAYEAALRSLVSGLRAAGVAAPFHVAVASRCTDRPWSADTPVALAQRRAVASPDALGLRPGPDADAVFGDGDRFDRCHFSAQGERAMADRWFDALRTPAPR